MNFKVRATTKKAKAVYYPRIMIDPESESIYFMTAPSTGTKLVQGETGINKKYAVGETRDDWTESFLVDYEGEIVLECHKICSGPGGGGGGA